MKKLLLTIAAVVTTMISGSGIAWADTETETLSTTAKGVHQKSQPVGGLCYSIAGTFVADYVSDTQFKIRTNQTVGELKNTIRIDVNEGYSISQVAIKAKAVTSKSTLKIEHVYVDEDFTTDLISESVSFSTTESTQTISGLNASKAIYLVTDAGSTQLQFGATFTYTDTFEKPENTTAVTATWAFTSGKGESATYTDNGAFSVSGVTLERGFEYNSDTKSFADQTFTQLTYKGSSDKLDAITDSCRVKFTLTPKKGITFVPTKVSFKAVKFGTSNGKITYAISYDNGRVVLAKAQSVNKNDATTYSTFSKSVSGIRTNADNPCTLEVYIFLRSLLKTMVLQM